MPIVLLSSEPHGLGLKLAEQLADKTHWPLYSRDQLVDEANAQGIKLSRLETSIIKKPIIPEKLAWEKELYLSFVIDTLCRKMMDGNLIYSGRAGNLLMPGVSHMVRVGVRTPMEQRIKNVIKDLNLPREKAVDYLNALDEDIAKWIHFVHRESNAGPSRFDLFLNLKSISLAHATDLVLKTAELPDFAPTAASTQRFQELHLAAKARLHLNQNRETAGLNLGVRATGGVVTVTYMPRQETAADSIARVLESLDDCRENICTMAETNILYIQERFDPKNEAFTHVTHLAKRWGAAVELLRLVPGPDESEAQAEMPADLSAGEQIPPEDGNTNRNLAYAMPESGLDDGGLARAREEMVAMGRSAGCFTITGGKRELLTAIKGNSNYSMVILGNLFLSKGHQTRTRLTRELGLSIKEVLKTPVITEDALQSRFLFGKQQAIKLCISSIDVFAIYELVFRFQEPILNILGGELHARWKWAAAIGVALFVPVVAYSYGTVTGLLLKLVDID